MSDPVITIPGNPVHSVTLSISAKPSPQEVIKSMAEVAKFLTKLAVEILRDDKGTPAMVSPANPAPNAMLQSAATLETGAIQFDALVKQQAGLIGPQAAGPQGRFRTN